MHKFVYKNCIGMVIFVMQAHANPERLEEIYKNCNIRFSFLPFSACQTLKIFMLCISWKTKILGGKQDIPKYIDKWGTDKATIPT